MRDSYSAKWPHAWGRTATRIENKSHLSSPYFVQIPSPFQYFQLLDISEWFTWSFLRSFLLFQSDFLCFSPSSNLHINQYCISCRYFCAYRDAVTQPVTQQDNLTLDCKEKNIKILFASKYFICEYAVFGSRSDLMIKWDWRWNDFVTEW